MTTLLADTCRSLDKVDYRILRLLDRLLSQYEYVPVEIIERRTKIPPKVLAKRLDKMHKLKVIARSPAPRLGYRLTYMGLDCLAIRTLVDRNVITHLGPQIGMGKESEIYLAKNAEDKVVALKLYKIGRVSFQKVVRVRDYLTDEVNWLIRSKVAAEREYKALLDLKKYTKYVPEAFGWNRHAVVTEFINGVELYRYREASDPLNILQKILEVIRVAYNDVGIVHGDLSEYNVVVDVEAGEIPYIIDWPQYVYRDDPRAPELLRRDTHYVVKFFKRRYGVELDVDRALRYVKGETDEI